MDKKGQIQKGEHRSKETEFQKGAKNWRPHKPFREKSWLEHEYVENERSAADIAKQFEVTEGAILFWLNRHNIPRRTIQQARSVKYWGLSGETNGMYGKKGTQNPNWKGGLTPERQALYSSIEWKQLVDAVWQRDDATCQRCGFQTTNRRRLHVHHILAFKTKEAQCELSNVVLLCSKCHKWVHSKRNEKGEWIRDATE